MPSTLIPFNPSPAANTQFQATLDGNLYLCVVWFNAYGQRYYLNVYDLAGNVVLSRPVIGSPSFFNVSLTAGYFDTSIVFREANQTFEIPGLPPVPLPVRAPSPPVPPPPPLPPTDPYFADVVLLLHFDGGAGSPTFIDSSNYDQEIATFGGIQQETAIVDFGASSAGFNGTSQYLQSTSTAYATATGQDFTIEQQVYWTGENATPHIWQLDTGTEGVRFNLFLLEGTIALNIDGDGTSANVITAAFTLTNQWVAVALTRAANTTRLFVNGILVGSTDVSIPDGLNILSIGYQPRPTNFASDYWDGYMDEFRYTVGVARYTANYTPQTAPFPSA